MRTDNEGKLRYRRSLKTSGAAIFERGSFFLITIVAIPLTIEYLGKERFSIWMILMSFVGLLSISDFGMSFGLQNSISSAYGRSEENQIKTYISNGLGIFTVIAITLFFLSIVIIPSINVLALVNIKNSMYESEIRRALFILVVTFAFSLPLKIGGVVLIAFQEGFINRYWSICKNIFTMLIIIVISKYKLGIDWLILGMYSIPLIFSLFNSIYVLGFRYKNLSPEWNCISKQSIKKVFKSGLGFFGLQFISIFANNLDLIIVAQTMNATAVAVYSIASKLFRPISISYSILLSPLWPAYRAAQAGNDWKWIKNTLIISLVVGVGIAIIIGIPLSIFGSKIIHLWTKSNIYPNQMLLLGFFAFNVLLGITVSFDNFLNGLQRLKYQIFYQTIYTLIAFFSKIILGIKYGAMGVIWGAVISNGLFLIWAQGLDAYYVLKNKYLGS